MEEYVRRFRKIQTLVSIAIFCSVFLFCWWTTDFNLKEIQLSYWGIDSKVGILWNVSVVLMSISIFFNAAYYLKKQLRLLYVKSFYYWFGLISIFLLIVGVIPMHNKIHDISAVLYFFAYPFVIFALAHWNRKHLLYKEWLGHTILSILMVVLPAALLYFFKGMAISETVHVIIVIIWNLWLLKRVV